LWMFCNDTNEMDIYVSLRKVSKTGKVLEHCSIPWEALPDHVSTRDDVLDANVVKVQEIHSS
jgi:uncharacterized protein